MNILTWLSSRITRFCIVLGFILLLYLFLDIILGAIGSVILFIIAIWPFMIIAVPILAFYLIVSAVVEFIRFIFKK